MLDKLDHLLPWTRSLKRDDGTEAEFEVEAESEPQVAPSHSLYQSV